MNTEKEVDILVAEWVMEWKRAGDRDSTSPLHREVNITSNIGGKDVVLGIENRNDWDFKGPHPRLENKDGEAYYFCACQEERGIEIPYYSTDISAAKQVIMEMVVGRNYAFRLDIAYGTPLLAEARFWAPISGMHGKPFTAFGPMERAICLAALKAVGMDMENH